MDPLTSPARTWLFVPGDRHDRFEKAASSGADRVIIDLEDAIPPEAKVEARRALHGVEMPTRVPVYVRVNAVGTEWFADDVTAVASLAVAGVVLPKVDGDTHVARAAAALTGARPIVPIIETAQGLWNVGEIAQAPRVERLVFGALDFELDTGIRDTTESHAHARSRIALASRVARRGAPIDSVTLGIDDDPQLTRDAERSRRFGFGGKLCIHPRQIEPIHAAFRPSPEELEWARALLEARDSRPLGAAFAFRGTMVDRPVVERAERILVMAGERL